VQIDAKEVRVAGQKCFQYTALDDCTRYRVLRFYPRKYHGTSIDFLATVRQALPFPIRKVQVYNGGEFPLTVQEAGIRLRYIKPRRPEQNGKVERSHRIDEEEFWSRSTFDGFTSAAQALHAWGASVQPRSLLHGPPGPHTRREIGNSALATDTISIIRTMHAHGGHRLTSHYKLRSWLSSSSRGRPLPTKT